MATVKIKRGLASQLSFGKTSNTGSCQEVLPTDPKILDERICGLEKELLREEKTLDGLERIVAVYESSARRPAKDSLKEFGSHSSFFFKTKASSRPSTAGSDLIRDRSVSQSNSTFSSQSSHSARSQKTITADSLQKSAENGDLNSVASQDASLKSAKSRDLMLEARICLTDTETHIGEQPARPLDQLTLNSSQVILVPHHLQRRASKRGLGSIFSSPLAIQHKLDCKHSKEAQESVDSVEKHVRESESRIWELKFTLKQLRSRKVNLLQKSRKASPQKLLEINSGLARLTFHRDINEDFDIGAQIGKGSSGEVFYATQKRNGQLCALKRVRLNVETWDDIKHEIDLLTVLRSPYVVRYFGSYCSENFLTIALEYCEGGSVGAFVRRHPLREGVAAAVAGQVLRGMDYLHNMNLIHRDIKAANLLICKTPHCRVKIGDFGISVGSKSTGIDSCVGSAYWMAPELLGSDEEETVVSSPASDIWSFGITLIESVLGVPPNFDSAPMSAIYRTKTLPSPRLPEGFSPSFQEFVQICLQKIPEARPSASELQLHDFISTAKGESLNELLDANI